MCIPFVPKKWLGTSCPPSAGGAGGGAGSKLHIGNIRKYTGIYRNIRKPCLSVERIFDIARCANANVKNPLDINFSGKYLRFPYETLRFGRADF